MKPQSMEEKISYRLFFMGFVGLVCTAVLCLFVFHKAFREQAWTSLEHQADVVSAGYEQLSSPDQLSVFVNGDLRITLIAADGSVVFESATDQQMENHLPRPEIQQAMREGVGRNCRDSQTMGYETYYYAMLLPGGDILRVAQDSETIWSIYDAALPAIILSCILMMGAAALIAGLLTRSLVQPILKMTDDLEHIQENVPYRELIPFAESIHSDRLLRENNEKMRQDFTANVSHELKTPLTLILSNLDILEAEYGKNEWLDDIRSEGERMGLLINQLVTLSRMDESDARLLYADFDLSGAINDTVSEFQYLAEERGHILFSDIAPSLSYHGVEALIRKLAAILLDNAIKYCDAGGKIQVRLYQRRHPILTVENTYAEVDSLELERLFDRFYRADRVRTFSGSFGVGLSIAQSIVKSHRGTITAYKKEGLIGFRVNLK